MENELMHHGSGLDVGDSGGVMGDWDGRSLSII